MRVHILGIGGTFMAGLAVIAQQAGFVVTGSDENLYPPMSDVLANVGIQVTEGYNGLTRAALAQFDMVVVGNVLSRGNAALESVIDSGLPYFSGPQWLYEQVLCQRQVCAIAGTHGKTTTSSMVAWILQCAGLNPGFLIGGLPHDFQTSARLTDSEFFVIEADEYDTAFFDKRPKFLHYRPRTLVLNNLEFDHADIYPDLEAIQQQCHYLLRTVPAKGSVIFNADDQHLPAVLEKGCWSQQTMFSLSQSAHWQAHKRMEDGSVFDLWHQGQTIGEVTWSLVGDYNLSNALAAAAAAFDLGVSYEAILTGLSTFTGVAKRMQCVAENNNIKVHRDFAHHPTAIANVIAAVRSQRETRRIIVMLECGSRTMQRHVDVAQLAQALKDADHTCILDTAEMQWSLTELQPHLGERLTIAPDMQSEVMKWAPQLQSGDRVLLLSNKNFSDVADSFKVILQPNEVK